MHARRMITLPLCAALAVAAVIATTDSVQAQPEGAPAGVAAADSASVYPDVSSIASQDLAMRIAERYGHSVTVSSQTTETDEVSANPDGTMTTTSNALPVRVKQAGSWVAVDPTLHVAGDGWLEPSAVPVRVRFTAGGSAELAKIQAESGQWLSVTWPSGALPAPILSGSAALYPDVFPGVDLQMTASSLGFSEVLVVKSAVAAARPELNGVRFGVNGGALTSVPGADGSLESRSSDGSVALREGQPTWWDSHGTGASAEGPSDNGVPRPLPTASSDAVSVTVDASSLAANPSTRYPAYVDPSWTGGRQRWTFTDSAYPTTNYLNGAGASDSYAHSGHVDSAWSDDGRNHTARAYFQMNTSGVRGKHILHAEFNAKLAYSSTCTSTKVRLQTANQAIGIGTTWNSQPGLSTVQDTKAGAWRSTCQNGGATGLPMGFNATQVVAYAAQRNYPSATLALVSTNEGDRRTWKKFLNNPSIAITYNSIPGQPAGRSITPCYLQCVSPTSTSRTTPTLTGATNDSDGGNLRYDYEVWAGHAASPTSRVAYGSVTVVQGARSAWAVPAGKLVNAGQYEYRLRAWDGTDFGPWSSGWSLFNVDRSLPDAPDATATNAQLDPNGEPIGTVGAPITLNFATSHNAGIRQIGYVLADKVPVFRTPPACGSNTEGFWIICPNAQGVWPKAVVAAIDESTRITILGWDAAGNKSTTGGLELRVNPDLSAMATGHSWPVDPNVVGSVPDTAVVAPAPLFEYPGVTRGQGAPNSQMLGVDDGAKPVPLTVYDEVFPGTSAAHTAVRILDTTKSFTVAAWLKPNAASVAGQAWTALAQDGAKSSVFLLQNRVGHWGFCLQHADTPTFSGTCAQTASTVSANTWAYVIGQWDAVNHVARVSIGNGNWASAAHATAPASNGQLWVGRDKIGTVLRYWPGEIYDPMVVQGIPTASQLAELMSYTSPVCLSATATATATAPDSALATCTPSQS